MNSIFALFLLISLSQTVLCLPDGCDCRAPNRLRRVWPFNRNTAQVPWSVSVQYKQHICHGVILDEETVISSASCLDGFKPEQVLVVAGIDDLEKKSDSKTYRVNSINLPANFSVNIGEKNVAILKLATKLDLENGKVEKACLRMTDDKIIKAEFRGFGSDQTLQLNITDGKISPAPVPSSTVKVLNFKSIDGIATNGTELNMIVTSGRKGICLMDEGGSLFVRENQNAFTVAIADQALLSNSRRYADMADMCATRSKFIKISTIASFIKKFETPSMCLIN